MRLFLYILFALPFCVNSQVKSIKINVNLEKIEDDSKVDIATVRLVKNEKEVLKTVLQKGRFKHKLDTGAVYKIYFSKVNHATKHLLVDTRMMPKKSKQRQKLRVTMVYFIQPEKNDLSFLDKTPVGVARYDVQHNKLRWDYEYAFLINEKIGQLLYEF